MKAVEKKVAEVQHRVSKLKDLALRLHSFEDYVSSRDTMDIIDNALIDGIIKKHLNNFEDFLNQVRDYYAPNP